MKIIESMNSSFKLTGYEFKDLSEDAQSKAIGEQIDFLIEIYDPDDESCVIHDQVKEMEKFHTPWFLAEAIYENHKDYIVELLEINEYLFYSNGSLMYVTDYIDENDECYKHTLSFYGDEFEVTVRKVVE